MAVKYAWCREVPGDCHWTLKPWYLMGMQVFDRLADIPSDHVLVTSHFAPWWEPFRSWIADRRPWIEIEYGYWGPFDRKGRRASRRVTYCGHHNLNVSARPWNRTDLFTEPAMQPWQLRPGDYVIAMEPQSEMLSQRTGVSIEDWKSNFEQQIRSHWSGDIVWQIKAGDRRRRWQRFCDKLQHAHAVVGERTMACVEAVALGIPAYTTDITMSTLLMGSIENLSNPECPDRTDWWDHVCWSQFHATEFETAAPAELTEFYQITGKAENVDRYRPVGLLDHSSELLTTHESTECGQTPERTQSD